MAVSHIHFQSIPVEDQSRAVDFYTGHLGFELHTDAPYGDDWRWIFLTLPGARTRLHLARTTEVQFNETPALCLVCDDVDDEAKTLSGNGVEIAGGPDDAPWQPGVRWLMIRDSEGNQVLLESMKEG